MFLPSLNLWFSSGFFMALQIEREKLHGCIDVGLSVMSVKKSCKCIDLDTEEHIYHLKVRLLLSVLPVFQIPFGLFILISVSFLV